MFPIVQVDSRRREALEPLGTKPKFWYRDPDGRQFLFKAEERGTGEDWAEKIACELCARLHLPHVHYEMAHDSHRDMPGVVCETCAPPPVMMALGNQLLQTLDPAYPQGGKYKVHGHTVEAVCSAVELLQLSPDQYCRNLPDGIDSALAVFTGYVMLDAWIANQDRHHENWAALLCDDVLRLAPTFDHGASLARNLSDGERRERLASRDRGRMVAAFARRAKSAFYADPSQTRPMSTMEAWQAFSRKTPEEGIIWMRRLEAVSQADVEAVLKEIAPQRMSHVAREFSLRLLMENRRRLLDGGE